MSVFQRQLSCSSLVCPQRMIYCGTAWAGFSEAFVGENCPSRRQKVSACLCFHLQPFAGVVGHVPFLCPSCTLMYFWDLCSDCHYNWVYMRCSGFNETPHLLACCCRLHHKLLLICHGTATASRVAQHKGSWLTASEPCLVSGMAKLWAITGRPRWLW